MELEGALMGRVEVGIQRYQKTLHMFHHLKVGESLDNKVSSMYYAIDPIM